MKVKSRSQIALFLPNLAGGGAERIMANLAAGFAERGYAVDVVLIQAQGVFLSRLPANVRVVDLHAASAYTALPGLVNYLRREKPDALLSTLDLTNLVAILAKIISRVTTRVVVRIASTVSQQKRPFYKKKLERIFLSRIYPMADAIVAISCGAAEDLARYTGIDADRINAIYNPVINAELHRQVQQPLDHLWYVQGDTPVILGVGRLTVQKDFLTLIRACAIVRRERPVRLVILGEGEERANLEALVGELGFSADIQMPGFIENPFPYMAAASVFVLSSRWEGLPGVLIEALACGCPAVSTDCPSGPSEILDGGRYGHLVPVGDAEAMARAILSVLNGDLRKPPNSWLRKFEFEPILHQYLAVMGLDRERSQQLEAKREPGLS